MGHYRENRRRSLSVIRDGSADDRAEELAVIDVTGGERDCDIGIHADDSASMFSS